MTHRRSRIALATALAVGACIAPSSAIAAAAAQDGDDDVIVSANPTATAQPAPQAPPTRSPSPVTAPAGAQSAAATPTTPFAELLSTFSAMGFAQGDYVNNQASQDQLAPGGAPLNQDRFILRRGRARLDGEWKFAHAQLELDGNTTNGPVLRLFHAFATVKLPNLWAKDATEPLAAVSMGLFDTPFGYELGEAPNTRWFVERSGASGAFFGNAPDVGLRVHGGVSFLRWSFAAMNGQPLDTPGFPLQSPLGAKDFVFRVGADVRPRDDLRISGSVSGLRGKGFHKGTDATKNTVEWRDVNEDGIIQPSELIGSPATAATPSVGFDHWLVGADLQARLRTKLGESLLYGEVYVATNMDRTTFVADPIAIGQDTRELGFYAGFVQEITRWGAVGFRYAFYDPNMDAFDKRQGKLLPTNQTIQTFSPLAVLRLPKGFPGAMVPGDRARFVFQYDVVQDALGRNAQGLPAGIANNQLTLRLQVEL